MDGGRPGRRRAARAVGYGARATGARDPGLTLAQVQDALGKQTWVHVKYEDGREFWTNLVDGRNAWKDAQGGASFTGTDGVSFWGHRDHDFVWTRQYPAAATRPRSWTRLKACASSAVPRRRRL